MKLHLFLRPIISLRLRFKLFSFLLAFLLVGSFGLINSPVRAAGPNITQAIFTQITSNNASFTLQVDRTVQASMQITTTTGYSSTLTDTLASVHTFGFYPLNPDTTYYYQYIITDTTGSVTNSIPDTFVTASTTNSFYFKDLSVTSNNNNIQISWTTSFGATTNLDYGLSSSYGNTSSLGNFTTSHGISLSNLSPGAIYHFRLRDTASDPSYNLTSPDMIFTAPGTPVTTATPTPTATATTVTSTATPTPTTATATTVISTATPTITTPTTTAITTSTATATPTPTSTSTTPAPTNTPTPTTAITTSTATATPTTPLTNTTVATTATATPTTVVTTPAPTTVATPTSTTTTLTATSTGTVTVPPSTTPANGPIIVVDQVQINFSGTSGDILNGLPSQSVQITSTTSASWQAQLFTNNGGNWLNVSPLSGNLSFIAAENKYKSVLTFTVNALNLAPGQYNGGIFISNTSNPAQASLIVSVSLNVTSTPTGTVATTIVNTATVTPTPPVSGFSYFLPFLSNGTNGYTTYLTLQNRGSGKANVSITYYDTNGQNYGSSVINQILAGAQWNPANGFAIGRGGDAQIYSDQPLNIVVSESTPSGGSAFLLNNVTSSKLIAPLILRKAYGNFSTTIYVMNTSVTPATVHVSFYAANGTFTKLQTLNLASHASINLAQDDAQSGLPDGFTGWALIDAGTSGSISAQVLESNSLIGFTATFGTVSAPFVNTNFAMSNHSVGTSTTLYAPAVFNGAFGNFYSGMTLVNANDVPANVTIQYYDPTQGVSVLSKQFQLGANAAQLIFHGDPNVGLPSHFFGSATISSDQPLAGVLNENGGGATSGTYNLLSSGGQSVSLPVLANGAYGGYISGLTVLNLTSNPVNFKLQYYNSLGNPVGANLAYTLSPHGSQPIYQGDVSEQLPPGFFGTALLVADIPNSVAVTTNVANSQFFYTYTSP